MNRRSVWLGLGIGCVAWIVWPALLCGTASTAQAQPAPVASSGGGSGLPPSVKSAPDASVFRAQIQSFVQGQVAAMIGEDAAAQKTARDKLISECTAGSSQSYFDLYAQTVNDELLGNLTQNKPLRVRLNAAVLVEAIANVGKTSKVEPVVIRLVSDPLEPVSMKGMSAAKPVLTIVYQTPAQIAGNKLIAAIPAAVKSHPKSGFIAADAYRALIPEASPALTAAQVAAVVPSVIDPILDILDFRVAMYEKGLPDNPDAERALPTFLFNHFKTLQAAPAKQSRIVQGLVNLVTLAGEQVQNGGKAELDQVRPVVQRAAQTLNAVASNPAATTALAPLLSAPPGQTGKDFVKNTRAVFPAMQLVFKDLKQPPPVSPAPAANAPAIPSTATTR